MLYSPLPHHHMDSPSSLSSKPLQIWDATVQNGHVKRITDPDIQSSVLEIMGTNVSTNYIVCPAEAKKTLGIKLPFLVMILKNMKKYFTFEVQVLDDKNVRRRFRASNYQSTTRVKPFICTMPMRLDDGWNQIQFNLSDFTRRAYGTNYIETLRVQIHANCRIRRVYFSDRLYTEDELPAEFRLLLPIAKSKNAGISKERGTGVEKEASATTAAAAAVRKWDANTQKHVIQSGKNGDSSSEDETEKNVAPSQISGST
mmetsp:Transcript_22728/g.47174  ORF Transcript_22728/g.47174 Transcript_22728/m.47174 type:complete len:257 (+) Transcript_22728:553-1323(+)